MAKAPVMRKNMYRPPSLGAQHRENHGPTPSSLLQLPKALSAHLTSFHMRNEDISPKKGGRLWHRGYPGSGRSCLGSSSSKQMDNLYVFSHLEHTRHTGNGEVCNLSTMNTGRKRSQAQPGLAVNSRPATRTQSCFLCHPTVLCPAF